MNNPNPMTGDEARAIVAAIAQSAKLWEPRLEENAMYRGEAKKVGKTYEANLRDAAPSDLVSRAKRRVIVTRCVKQPVKGGDPYWFMDFVLEEGQKPLPDSPWQPWSVVSFPSRE